MARLLSEKEEKQILATIRVAELETSGEICVHIQKRGGNNIHEAAWKQFHKLGMNKTKQRNGVLFFIAVNDRRFAVIGDEGIHKAVPENRTESTVETMSSYFKKGDFAAGIEAGILKAGDALKKYFPHQDDDVNEINDSISIQE